MDIISVAVALAAVAVAFFSWQAAYYTVIVGVYYQLLQSYSSKEMCNDLRLLGAWEDKEPSEYLTFAYAYRDYFKRNPELEEVDAARRNVEHYFKNAHRIFKNFKWANKYKQSILRLHGIRLYFLVIEQMEKAMGEIDGNEYNLNEFFEIYQIAHTESDKWGRPALEIQSYISNAKM